MDWRSGIISTLVSEREILRRTNSNRNDDLQVSRSMARNSHL